MKKEFFCKIFGHDPVWEYLPYGPAKICHRCLEALDYSLYRSDLGHYDYSGVAGEVSIFVHYRNKPPVDRWISGGKTNRCKYCGNGKRIQHKRGDYCASCSAPWEEEIVPVEYSYLP